MGGGGGGGGGVGIEVNCLLSVQLSSESQVGM